MVEFHPTKQQLRVCFQVPVGDPPFTVLAPPAPMKLTDYVDAVLQEPQSALMTWSPDARTMADLRELWEEFHPGEHDFLVHLEGFVRITPTRTALTPSLEKGGFRWDKPQATTVTTEPLHLLTFQTADTLLLGDLVQWERSQDIEPVHTLDRGLFYYRALYTLKDIVRVKDWFRDRDGVELGGTGGP